jgi:hypothetical protein
VETGTLRIEILLPSSPVYSLPLLLPSTPFSSSEEVEREQRYQKGGWRGEGEKGCGIVQGDPRTSGNVYRATKEEDGEAKRSGNVSRDTKEEDREEKPMGP